MKTTITITLDTDLIIEARERRIPFSKTFNEHLRIVLNREKEMVGENVENQILSLKSQLLVKQAELDNERKNKEAREMKMREKGWIKEI